MCEFLLAHTLRGTGHCHAGLFLSVWWMWGAPRCGLMWIFLTPEEVGHSLIHLPHLKVFLYEVPLKNFAHFCLPDSLGCSVVTLQKFFVYPGPELFVSYLWAIMSHSVPWLFTPWGDLSRNWKVAHLLETSATRDKCNYVSLMVILSGSYLRKDSLLQGHEIISVSSSENVMLCLLFLAFDLPGLDFCM